MEDFSYVLQFADSVPQQKILIENVRRYIEKKEETRERTARKREESFLSRR